MSWQFKKAKISIKNGNVMRWINCSDSTNIADQVRLCKKNLAKDM